MKVSSLFTTSLAFAAAVLVVAGSANAEVISWSVDNNNTIGGGGTAVDASTIDASSTGGQAGPDDFAGVVNADYWGNSWNGSFQNFGPTNLLNDSGVATTADLSVVGVNDFNFGSPGVDSDGNWNRTMLYAYANGSAPAGVTYTLSEIPYAQYDVYVYLMSDDDSRVYSVTDGTTTYFGGAHPTSISGNNPALFAQTTATTNAGFSTDANYAVFSGLTGANQVFSSSFFASDGVTPDFGGISGIQIVRIPEPASLTMFALGGLLLVCRRR